MGFVSDQLITGRRFRVLSIVDDYSRELIGTISISVDVSSITRLKGINSHWSVICGMTNEGVALIDSNYLEEQERSACSISEEDNEHFYQLSVFETYFGYLRD